MAADGDLRWGPWLLDLLRLGPSNITDEHVAEALAVLSGIERSPDAFITEDYRVYGSGSTTPPPIPGPATGRGRSVSTIRSTTTTTGC